VIPTVTLGSGRRIVLRALVLTFVLRASAPAQATETTRLTVRPGGSVVLPPPSACVRAVVPPPGGPVEVAKVADTRSYAICRAPDDQRDNVAVTIVTGTAPNADSTVCQGEVQRHFYIATDQTPSIPQDALGKAAVAVHRVGYNAFITGISVDEGDRGWRDVSQISAEPNVIETAYGFMIGARAATLTFQIVQRSKEYKPGGGSHRFGALMFSLFSSRG